MLCKNCVCKGRTCEEVLDNRKLSRYNISVKVGFYLLT